MNERLEKWNRRYAAREETYDFAPSPPLPAALAYARPGRALDFAAGAGRHALYLAEHGWRVVAVDGAARGIELLRAEAARRGVADRIETRVADLTAEPPEFVIEPQAYDLVCDFYYLDRSAFPALRGAVCSGGLFVAAIHVLAPGTTPTMNPMFLLAPGELRELVSGWSFEVLHAHEGPPCEDGHHHGTAEVIARRP